MFDVLFPPQTRAFQDVSRFTASVPAGPEEHPEETPRARPLDERSPRTDQLFPNRKLLWGDESVTHRRGPYPLL